MKKINSLFLLLLLSVTFCTTEDIAEPIDKDGDGYVLVINGDSSEKEDCDDDNPDVNPGATEIPYNGIDDDCDPLTLDDDLDKDGFNKDVDCDDTDARIYPGAVEIPYNGIDEDCDESTSDTVDADGDGINSDTDCDDNNAEIFPGNTEVPYNGIDDDCDPLTLDDDLDEDGYNSDVDCDDTNADVNPGAEEIFTDDIDNNCNGVVGYIEIETVSVPCDNCASGNGNYYNDSNRRAGRECIDFDSDLTAAAAGFSACTETTGNVYYID
jgi:hypothetical protein